LRVVQDEDCLRVRFNYARDYVDRIKQVAGARYDPSTKTWTVPAGSLDRLEAVFPGELVYDTPREIITGEDDTSRFYSDVQPAGTIPTVLPLYKFQQFGAAFLKQRAMEAGFAFLCDATGIGKSPTALGARLLLMQELGVDELPTLIVSPVPVRRQWVVDAIPKFLGEQDVVEVRGDACSRQELYESDEIVVTNYEALLRDAPFVRRRFGLVIFDECQRLKNRQGKTYKATADLLKRTPGVMKFFLTATPIMNDLEELYALFGLASPGFLGKVSEFRKRYIRMDYSPGYPRLVGYRYLEELSEKVMPYILRRTEEHPEVRQYLPRLVEENLYVDPSPLQRKLHDMLWDEWVELLRARSHGEYSEEDEARSRGLLVLMQGAADDPRLFLMSDSGLVKPYLRVVGNHSSPSPKLLALEELVEDLVPQGKVLIFTQFERMSRLIAGQLSRFRPLLYTGKNRCERDASLDRFRSDSGCRVLACTDAGGVGLNLQAARFVVNFDMPWSPGQLDQRYGRIKRFASLHSSVTAFNLITNDTIDIRIMQAQARKQDLFSAVIYSVVT